MRSLTAQQQTALEAAEKWVSVRAFVGGAEITNYAGTNLFDSLSLAHNVDQPIRSLRLRVWRSANGMNVSPLVAGGISAGAVPVVVEVAVTPAGVGPAAGDWAEIFTGDLDGVSLAQNPMEIRARDGAGELVDRWIEEETDYAVDGAVSVETVMQAILDDWAPGHSLYVPSSPGFFIKPYTQIRQSVYDALRTLAALFGWDVRFEWDGGQYRVALVEPDRLTPSLSWTFGPSRYFDVSTLDIDRTFVRNAISLSYKDVDTGEREDVDIEDAASITQYKRRWMRIEEPDDSPVDTAAEAVTFATAALRDLSTPFADQEIETQFFWPIELGDYYRFSANGEHYTADIDLAVVGYRHELRRDFHRTVIQTRGKPAAFHLDWHRISRERKRVDRPRDLQLHNFREIGREDGQVTFGWLRGADVRHVVAFYNLVDLPVPDDPWPNDGDEPLFIRGRAENPNETETISIPLPATNQVGFLQIEARGADINDLGEVERATVLGAQGTLPYFSDLRTIQGAYPSADIYGRIIDPESRGNIGGVLRVWVNRDGPESPDPTGAADGEAEVPSAPFAFGPITVFDTPSGPTSLLNNIVFQPAKTKTVVLEYTSADGRTTGQFPYTMEDFLDLVDQVGELRANSITNALQFASGLDPILVLEELPPDNTESNVVFLISDTPPQLYRWDPDAEEWTVAIPAVNISGEIQAPQIADLAITTAKLANAAVEAGKIAAAAVDSAAIAPAAIQTAHIAADAIQAGNIAAGAVVAGKIGAEAIAAVNLQAGIIAAEHIQAAAIDTVHLRTAIIQTQHISAGNITAALLAANAVTAGAIAAGAVKAEAIEAGAVSTVALAAGAVTAEKLNVATLSAIAADIGEVVAGVIRNAASDFFIDLDASGAQPLISSPNFEVLRDGTVNLRANLTLSIIDGNAIEFRSSSFVQGRIEPYTDTGFDGVRISSGPLGIAFIEVMESVAPGGYVNISGPLQTSSLTLGGKAVSEGASGSGGTGFRVLRVPN